MKENPLRRPASVVMDYLFVERVKAICSEMPVVYAVGPALEGWVRVVFPSCKVSFFEPDRPGVYPNMVLLPNGDYRDLDDV